MCEEEQGLAQVQAQREACLGRIAAGRLDYQASLGALALVQDLQD